MPGKAWFKRTPILFQYRLGLPRWASQVAQWVKNLPAMQETQEKQVNPSVGKIPWRRAGQPTLVFLPGESHGQRSLPVIVHGVAKSRTWLKWLSTHIIPKLPRYLPLCYGRISVGLSGDRQYKCLRPLWAQIVPHIPTGLPSRSLQ